MDGVRDWLKDLRFSIFGLGRLHIGLEHILDLRVVNRYEHYRNVPLPTYPLDECFALIRDP